MLDGLHRIQERLDAVEQGRFARRRQSRQQQRRRALPHHSHPDPVSTDQSASSPSGEEHENHFVDLRV